MLVGAVMGFWAVQRIGGPRASSLAARDPRRGARRRSGGARSSRSSSITLRANQIVSGLALTIFAGAAGLSSYLGNDLDLADVARAARVQAVDAFGLQTCPSSARSSSARPGSSTRRGLCVIARRLYLSRTRPGSTCAPSGNRRRRRMRWGSTWSPTATPTPWRAARSRASAARASAWRSRRNGWTGSPAVPAGSRSPSSSSRSGGPSSVSWAPTSSARSQALPFTLQARGVTIAPEVFQSLPYVMTIVVLVLVSSGIGKRRLGAPGALGLPYVREER